MVSEARKFVEWLVCVCVGIPLLYMVVVVPLGFLVNTENGIHYGNYNTTTVYLSPFSITMTHSGSYAYKQNIFSVK